MLPRLRILTLLSFVIVAAIVFSQPASTKQTACSEERTLWVGQALQKMMSIKPGMTREQLLTAFTTEGGLSTGLRRSYVSKDCPYFKVDVEFEAVGRPSRDKDGRVTLVEDGLDRITKISQPYLQFKVMD